MKKEDILKEAISDVNKRAQMEQLKRHMNRMGEHRDRLLQQAEEVRSEITHATFTLAKLISGVEYDKPVVCTETGTRIVVKNVFISGTYPTLVVEVFGHDEDKDDSSVKFLGTDWELPDGS